MIIFFDTSDFKESSNIPAGVIKLICSVLLAYPLSHSHTDWLNGVLFPIVFMLDFDPRGSDLVVERRQRCRVSDQRCESPALMLRTDTENSARNID